MVVELLVVSAAALVCAGAGAATNGTAVVAAEAGETEVAVEVITALTFESATTATFESTLGSSITVVVDTGLLTALDASNASLVAYASA